MTSLPPRDSASDGDADWQVQLDLAGPKRGKGKCVRGKGKRKGDKLAGRTRGESEGHGNCIGKGEKRGERGRERGECIGRRGKKYGGRG